MGIKKTEKALRNDLSVELAEQMIAFLLSLSPPSEEPAMEHGEGHVLECNTLTETITIAPVAGAAAAAVAAVEEHINLNTAPPPPVRDDSFDNSVRALKVSKKVFAFAWLSALCHLSKFGMVLLMFDEVLRGQVIVWLESCGIDDAPRIINKFKK